MAKFQNPGNFFLGTLVPSEQKFLKTLIANALKSGYEKFLEPCAGAFAMSHLAVQAGFRSSQIESSDVSMFTTILGYAITGQSLEELSLKAVGFSDEELLDPATALYAWKYLNLTKNAGKDYFYNYLLDLEQRREEHIKFLNEQIARAKKILGGMNYRALDMWQHIDEVLENPRALIIANPPTYVAGFEKYYDTQGKMTWREPEYSLFDPKTGLQEFMTKVKDAKCLVMCYEENSPGETAGVPVFSRYGVRKGINVYLTSNRPEEAERLSKGKKISRPNETELFPLKCAMLPIDYEITEQSKIRVGRIEAKSAQYYRKLWTHNFVGSTAGINLAVFIDEKIAGVFGLNKESVTIGVYGATVSDYIFLMYGVTVAHRQYRLNRLLTMAAQNFGTLSEVCTDLELEKLKRLKTVQMTKYPEAKEMRGLMKLESRKKDPVHGYRLIYVSDLKDRTLEQTLAEWLRREKKWQQERAKSQR